MEKLSVECHKQRTRKKRQLATAEGGAKKMTVTIYANRVPIPEDQLDKFQITNPEFISFIQSVRKRILKDMERQMETERTKDD